jgi:hypothetical protein
MEMAMSQQTKQRPMAFNQKTCTKCGETKVLEEFGPQKKGKFGRHSQCRTCTNAAKREYIQSNPDYRARQYASSSERNKKRYHEDEAFREAVLVRTRRNLRKRREDPEKLAYDRERSRLYRAERYANDPEYRERHLAYHRDRYVNDPEYRERRLRENREAVARRSSRVLRIRKLLEHFEGRGAYLDYIAHAIASRSDAQGLQWLCQRIDELVAQRVYGEV